jgi:hypothetical protein
MERLACFYARISSKMKSEVSLIHMLKVASLRGETPARWLDIPLSRVGMKEPS